MPESYRPVEGEVRKQVFMDHPKPPEQPRGLLNRAQWVWEKDVKHILNIAAILDINGGECSYQQCCKGIAGEASKPELLEFMSKFCLHFDWSEI